VALELLQVPFHTQGTCNLCFKCLGVGDLESQLRFKWRPLLEISVL
jgi:hypothetical protein